MAEHVAYESTAKHPGLALTRAKATAKEQGRRVRTLVSVKGKPGAWTVTLALDEAS